MMPGTVARTKRILVLGAQMPFMRGGAEMAMDNLVAALTGAGHQAEQVRIPVAWDRARLFDAILAWRLVPLDADIVIATTFPSYFAKHPHKVVWLAHQHRPAYDLAGSPWSDIGLDDISLETQRLLADWDCRVLEEAQCLFTTSRVVGDRLLRFNGLASTPVYHPPPLSDVLHRGPFENYVFAPSRFAANKRLHLTVEALAQMPSHLHAVLTGPGALEDELVSIATRLRVRDRLEITGFIDDARMVDRFARALAVLYLPYDEDYGYVTLQAFLAGKPVITSRDSGGVLEWVEDGVNGFVTDGTPEAVADAVARLDADRDLARRLGEAGRARAATLRWDTVIDQLIGRNQRRIAGAA